MVRPLPSGLLRNVSFQNQGRPNHQATVMTHLQEVVSCLEFLASGTHSDIVHAIASYTQYTSETPRGEMETSGLVDASDGGGRIAIPVGSTPSSLIPFASHCFYTERERFVDRWHSCGALWPKKHEVHVDSTFTWRLLQSSYLAFTANF